MPSSSLATVAIRVDSETLSWFQSKGEEAEQHMAAALRIYAEAQKNVVKGGDRRDEEKSHDF
jgi:hypothetical protein